MFPFYNPLNNNVLRWGGVRYCLKIVKNKLVINIIICRFVIWWCV